MFSTLSRETLFNLILCWGVLGAILLVSMWRSRHAVGIPLVYAFWYSIIHVFGAWVYTVPGYVPRSQMLLDSGVSLLTTLLGFRVATLGFAGFVVGCLIAPFLFPLRPSEKPVAPPDPAVGVKLPGTLLLLGVLCFVAIGPVLKFVPSFGSLAGPGKTCSVAGVFLFCWLAFLNRNHKSFLFWLAATFGFPVVTILSEGFASYGALAAATVWMMVARFYRPRIVSLAALVIMVYGCITLYVNWMSEREAIRNSVWGGDALSRRFDRFKNIINNFEFFDMHKQRHLELVDGRLNQNDFVGKAVLHIQSGRVNFAQGGTFYIALVAWIPRIIWPGKPVTAGSGNMVAHFTGQTFAEGTSVGLGQALEFYGNYGYPGTFFGFLVLGLAMRFVDARAGHYLNIGDYWRFTCWLLPGLAMVQPGGMVSEITGSLALNVVFVVFMHRYLFAQYYRPIQAAWQAPGNLRGSRVPRYSSR